MNEEKTYIIKTTKHGLTVEHARNAPGAVNLEALGKLLEVAPDDAILVWGKPGSISAVTGPVQSRIRKDRRGGRQKKY